MIRAVFASSAPSVNDGIGTPDMLADISADEFIRMMVTNALSPMRVVESLQDLVLSTCTIGIMSSGQGSRSRSGLSQSETGITISPFKLN